MDERPVSIPLKLLALTMFVYLLAPLLVVVPISFSGDNYMIFPPGSWSTRWYGAIFKDARMASAFTTSITLASVKLVSPSKSSKSQNTAKRQPHTRIHQPKSRGQPDSRLTYPHLLCAARAQLSLRAQGQSKWSN